MSTGSRRLAFLGSELAHILGQIVCIRVKTLGKTNLAASRHIKMKKGTIPVDVRRPKKSLLKLSFQECRSGGNSYNLSNVRNFIIL